MGNSVNIDGDDKGNFIMVYDHVTPNPPGPPTIDVYALTGNINGASFTSWTLDNSGNAIYITAGTYPDVSLYSDGSANEIVHLTYIDGLGEVNVDDEDYSDYASNSVSLTPVTSPVSPVSGHVMTYPRIASPNSTGGSNDWTVVWQETDRISSPMNFLINGINCYTGTVSSVIPYNDASLMPLALPLYDAPNFEPVVTYTPSGPIYVGWNVNNLTPDLPTGSGYTDMFQSLYPVAVKCDYYGVPDINGLYWQVPNAVSNSLENWNYLSIAGRYSDQTYDDVLLTYSDGTYGLNILNKLVAVTATEFRLSTNSAQNSDRDSEMTLFNYSIFDTKGNQVFQFTGNQNDLIKLTNENRLSSSIYLVKGISLDGKICKSQKIFVN